MGKDSPQTRLRIMTKEENPTSLTKDAGEPGSPDTPEKVWGLQAPWFEGRMKRSPSLLRESGRERRLEWDDVRRANIEEQNLRKRSIAKTQKTEGRKKIIYRGEDSNSRSKRSIDRYGG